MKKSERELTGEKKKKNRKKTKTQETTNELKQSFQLLGQSERVRGKLLRFH